MRYRLATPFDELHIITAFSRMLRELEPLGHDVRPTDANVDLFWERVFLPALSSDQHGIVLAFVEGKCIGVMLATPERSFVEVPPKRAVAYGEWVDPEWRRQGIGVRLQQMAYARLHELGFRELVSNVALANVPGLRNHMKAGADIIGYVTRVTLTEGGSNG